MLRLSVGCTASLLLLVASAACGPNAAVQVAAGTTATPALTATPAFTATPACAPIAVLTGPPKPVTAVARVSAVAVARASGALVATPTPEPRAELVRQAVGTATAEAQVTPVPTRPPPTSTATRAPISYSMCVTAVSTHAQFTVVVVTPRTLQTPAPGPPPLPGAGSIPAPSPATLVSPDVLIPTDNNSLVQLHVGDRFVLLLGSYSPGIVDWQVQLSTPHILQRVGNAGQGAYQATKAGQTDLMATADWPCRKATPACMAPSRVFRFRIVVT